MIPLLAVLSALHLGPDPAPATAARRRIAAWTLETRADRFRGAVTCRLSSDSMHVERGVVIVRLSASADTLDAAYRLDGGAPVETRLEAMEMARRGLTLTEDALANPSGGLVRVPAARAAAARTLDVQPGRGRHAIRFRLDGLADALAAARAADCPLIADAPGEKP
jgi:hypothetical protein